MMQAVKSSSIEEWDHILMLDCGHAARVEFTTAAEAAATPVQDSYDCTLCSEYRVNNSDRTVTSAEAWKAHTYDCGIHPHSGEWVPKPVDNRCPICTKQLLPVFRVTEGHEKRSGSNPAPRTSKPVGFFPPGQGGEHSVNDRLDSTRDIPLTDEEAQRRDSRDMKVRRPKLKRFAYVICELVDGDPSFRHTFVGAEDADEAYSLGHDALKQPFRGFVNDYAFEVP